MMFPNVIFVTPSVAANTDIAPFRAKAVASTGRQHACPGVSLELSINVNATPVAALYTSTVER